MTDFRANLRTPLMAAIFLGLNWQGKYDIDLRQGMRLGAGLQEEELFLRDGISGSSHEPLSV